MTRPPPAPKHKIEPGRNLGGQYELIQEIGKGAFGKVFLAKDLVLAREVAIKILRKELAASQETISLFQREARLLSCFNHPNVVSIHTFGFEPPSLHYIVLEYVEGDPLESLIKGGKPLPPAMFCEIMSQVGQALSEAHRHGVMHLDLKPLNVLLSHRSHQATTVKIIDFGLAKVFDRARVHPDKKVWDSGGGPKGFGSPPYMAPEQHKAHSEFSDQWRPSHLRAAAHHPSNASPQTSPHDPSQPPTPPTVIDARADIYALGVMACELLCGTLPFDAASEMGFWFAKINGAPRLPGFSPDIDSTLSRALAVHPEDRYQSAAEFIEHIILAVKKWHPDGQSADPESLSLTRTPPPNPLQIALRDRKLYLQSPIDSRNAHITINVAVVYLSLKIFHHASTPSTTATSGPDAHAPTKRPSPDNFDLYAEHLRILATRVQQAAAFFRGVPLSPLSDNQIFLFGLSPTEDNTDEDAIDAALAVRSALLSLRQDPTVQVPFDAIFSLGIDAGPMLLVGDEHGHCITHGKPLLVARALASSSRSDEVRISHPFHRRVRGDIAYLISPPEPGSSTRDSGFVVQRKRVQRASLISRDLCGLYIQSHGRDPELQSLNTHVRALFQQPQGVLLQISGPPSVGKSRLLAEFAQNVESWEEIIFLEIGRCRSRQEPHVCAPFIQMLCTRLRIDDRDSSTSIDYKLNQFFCHWINKDPSEFDPEESALLAFIRDLLNTRSDKNSNGHQNNSHTSSGNTAISSQNHLRSNLTNHTAVQGGLASMHLDPNEVLPTVSQIAVELRWLTMFYRRLLEFHPVLIMIEDYHRAPPLTRTLIEHLWMQLSDEPVALLLVGQTKLKQLLISPQLRTHPRVHPPIELAPLPTHTMQQLIAHMLRRIPNPPAWLSTQLLQLSAGLPIIAEEILRDLSDEGELVIHDDVWSLRSPNPIQLEIPRSLERLLLNNLAHLSPAQLTILEAAACAPKRFWPSLLTSVVEPPIHVAHELNMLETQGILAQIDDIHPRNEPFYRFVHAATRRAIYHRLSTERRQSLHCVVANALERDPNRALLADDLALGRCLAEAAQPARAIHYLLNAAQRLSHRPPLQQALEILGECQTLIEAASLLQNPQDVTTYDAATAATDLLAELLRLQGAWSRALDLLERTERAAALHSSVSPLRARLNIHIADCLRVLGRSEEASSALDLASRILEPIAHHQPLLLLMLSTSQATESLAVNTLDPNHNTFRRLREQVESPVMTSQKSQEGRRVRARAYRVLGEVSFRSGLGAEAQQLFRRSQQIAIASQSTPDLMDVLLSLGDHAWAFQEYAQAQQLWQDVQITATEQDLLHTIAESQMRLALSHLASHEHPKALASATQAKHFFLQCQALEPLSRALPILGHCALATGDTDLALLCAQDGLKNALAIRSALALSLGHSLAQSLAALRSTQTPHDAATFDAFLTKYRDALTSHRLDLLAENLG